ncbi:MULTISPECIES: 1,2-phenylacetyl-CoA epoxidase subunit PaaE [Streptomyces]|uniref:Phenylacetate-CoA oxygenase/reductase subunit PaaK n=2 Tax=Streptomyces TaxID=1883 RepID=A0A3R7IXS8_9ACTN|nr:MULTISPECIES: 1,2-phenylacetyl-CoA epoxidase subunit PaaE [Streptomyces]KNE80759.1 phenylacetic acid degradation protein [Streptomyces fradiae]OFA49746.1 phenylacetic acid degradation protein [Streptomyces fradiae]PQM23054.1 phenylacetate-CoA oxygenase/reductase subunit PaaK [Streptomyces xinghaiensis]RKM91420.1 phenylacetate-CoA oxygenase/reductase subunit PaaK [Streptomyces xinghaiensis]RNC74944.1 phenylacetate-CoA oxygenase/reductase subunit PaaK [Streptomyces xinghaiensis]
MTAAARHGAFHPLRVAAVDRLTDDSVTVTFAVPPELRPAFRHRPGQHLTLRTRFDGAEVRRTYSICAPVTGPDGPDTLRVGIRLVEGGAFSTYALKELSAGDTLEVMTPAGRFVLDPRPGRYAAVVGGSGITPVLSIAATLLAREPEARFCLVRSDRTTASAMFLEELADLKDRHPRRFQLVQTFSREQQQTGPVSGRLDTERLTALLPALLPVDRVDGWFLCGPYGLVEGASRALRGLGVRRDRVHQEIFHVDGTDGVDGTNGTVTAGKGVAAAATAAPGPEESTLAVTLDGRSGDWPVRSGESLLETVLRNRSDAPYACKGGVCGTCRALLVSGEVRMDRNFALEPDELDAGYVLACQSHPATERVALDFDR